MTIKHHSGTGKTTITLTWLETRQIMNTIRLAEVIREKVCYVVASTTFIKKKENTLDVDTWHYDTGKGW